MIVSLAGSLYFIFLIVTLISFLLFYILKKISLFSRREKMQKVSSKTIFLSLFYSILTSCGLTFYIYLDQSICYNSVSGTCSNTVTHLTLSGVIGEMISVVFFLKVLACCFFIIAILKIFTVIVLTQIHYSRFFSQSIRPSDEFLRLCFKINNEFKENITFKVVPVSISFAGVIGFFRPLVIIPKKLMDTFSENELEAFMYHEAAHIVNRDNLMRFIILLCKSILFFIPLEVLYKKWDLERDLECDRFSSFYTNRPLSVASALLKVMKLSVLNNRKYSFGFSGFSGFSDFKNSFLKLRIEKLIKYSEENVITRSEFSGKSFFRLFSFENTYLLISPFLFIFSFLYVEFFFHCFMEILIANHI